MVITGPDTTGPVQAADEAGVYGIGYDSRNSCDVAPDSCLTTPYWEWGVFYTDMVQEMIDGTFVPDDIYFDVDSGALGLLGFMEGQTPSPSVPEEVIPQVREMLDQMLAGEIDRFDIFTGPINNNQGEEIIPAGVSLTQSDLEGLVESVAEETGREACTICMNWLAEGVSPEAELP